MAGRALIITKFVTVEIGVCVVHAEISLGVVQPVVSNSTKRAKTCYFHLPTARRRLHENQNRSPRDPKDGNKIMLTGVIKKKPSNVSIPRLTVRIQ